MQLQQHQQEIGGELWVLDDGEILHSKLYSYGYVLIIQSICFGWFPLGALAFVTVKILLALHNPPPSISSVALSVAEKKETRDVTTVVLAIFVVFLFPNIPFSFTQNNSDHK